MRFSGSVAWPISYSRKSQSQFSSVNLLGLKSRKHYDTLFELGLKVYLDLVIHSGLQESILSITVTELSVANDHRVETSSSVFATCMPRALVAQDFILENTD